MGRIPQATFNKVSQRVGTPGVDPTAGNVTGILAQTANELNKVVRAKQEILHQTQSDRMLLDYTLGTDKALKQIMAENSNDPSVWVDKGKEVSDNLLNNMVSGVDNSRVSQLFQQKANRARNSSIVGFLRESDKAITKKALEEFDNTLIKGVAVAGELTSLNETSDLLNQIYAQIDGSKVLPEGKGKLEIKRNFAREAITQTLYNMNPADALVDLQKSGLAKEAFDEDKLLKLKDSLVERAEAFKEEQVIKGVIDNRKAFLDLGIDLISGDRDSYKKFQVVKGMLDRDPKTSPEDRKLLQGMEEYANRRVANNEPLNDTDTQFGISLKVNNILEAIPNAESWEERRPLLEEIGRIQSAIYGAMYSRKLNSETGNKMLTALKVNSEMLTSEEEQGRSGVSRDIGNILRMVSVSNGEEGSKAVDWKKTGSKMDLNDAVLDYYSQRSAVMGERKGKGPFPEDLTPKENVKVMRNVRYNFLSKNFGIPDSELQKVVESGKSGRYALSFSDGIGTITINPDFTFTVIRRTDLTQSGGQQ